MNSIGRLMLIALIALPAFAQAEETLTISCSAQCSLDAPKAPFDYPTCDDRQFDDALIEAAAHGDRSAIGLLKERHETTLSLLERIRIDGALLHEESKYWNELYEFAENAVRFARHQYEDTPEFEAWCTEHEIEPGPYQDVTFLAFNKASADPRGHALALRAMATDDLVIIPEAIHGLGAQHDDASLALIEKTIERFPRDAASLAFSLYAFRTEAANALAARHLSPQDFSDFQQIQSEGLQ